MSVVPTHGVCREATELCFGCTLSTTLVNFNSLVLTAGELDILSVMPSRLGSYYFHYDAVWLELDLKQLDGWLREGPDDRENTDLTTSTGWVHTNTLASCTRKSSRTSSVSCCVFGMSLTIAVGRASIADVEQLLGVSPTQRYPSCFTPIAPRQGSPAWLQSKTGICYLSRACAAR